MGPSTPRKIESMSTIQEGRDPASTAPEAEEKNNRWILVIEDDADVCNLLTEGLTKAGYRVVQAMHLGEANAKLAQQRFDCIVTDLYLGKGDGSQVIQGVRLSRGINAKSPILLMSAHLEIEIIKKLRPMINTVLVKPFDMTSFLTRVGDLVNVAAA
jgi:two-component system copper resistance phosphate regulon response regulator CusR